MNATEKQQVFISHSATDTEWARSFARALEDRGVTVWLDEFNLQPGDSIREALERALRSSDVLVTLVDAGAPVKPYLYFELGAAIGMGKRVVPIVPKDLDPKALPLDMRMRRYLVRETPEQTAEQLSHTLLAA
ncbi:MAG TPA: toll/interleukin-1 receptor domain-containing protein [Bryobacteraceae bacterium]|nr:toll/interleukin-1 receptor domain-containing protein [Bryobacteraceae bacterium]